MNKERSLANKILLFVYPLFYLLMLVATVLFGVYAVRDNPIKLIAVGLMGLYICYRLAVRTSNLVQAFFTEQTEETDDDDIDQLFE